MGDSGPEKKQVFVSYAHADDTPLDDGVPGWVSFFVDKLNKTVARQSGGANIGFWMDHSLEPQRRVDEELRRRIRESAVILALISPRYLESKWCQLEMATFVEEIGGGLSADRVFMVEVLRTVRENWHVAVRDLSPVTFWACSLTNPEPKTLGWPLPNVKGDRDYWDAVNALASQLARQLATLTSQGPPPTSAGPEVPAPATRAVVQTMFTPSFELPVTADTSEVSRGPLPEGPLSILINADTEDHTLAEEAQQILGELDADAYIAPVPVAHQAPADYRRDLEGRLRDSHGVIVVYGKAPPTWVQAKHGDVRKVLALERRGTWAGLLEGPPVPKPAHGLPPRGLMVLNCREGVDKAELDRFVQALRSGAAGV